MHNSEAIAGNSHIVPHSFHSVSKVASYLSQSPLSSLLFSSPAIPCLHTPHTNSSISEIRTFSSSDASLSLAWKQAGEFAGGVSISNPRVIHLAEEDGQKVNNFLEMDRGEGVNDGFSGPGPNDSLLPGLIDDVALNCLAWVSGSDYTSLSCINKRFNKLINSGYLYGLRKQLRAVEHLVYMVCDPRGWVAFDPKVNKWMSLPKIPCDECFNHADKESLAVGCELLVFGREMMEFAIWKYSMVCRGWVKCQGMNQPRCLFGSSSLGSIAIIAGGSDKYGNVLKSAELYDSSSGMWELLPSMHTPRRLCSGFFMDGKFYVIGGMSSITVSLTCGEEYDPKTRNWRKIEGMYPYVNEGVQAPPLVAVVDNQLYAVEHVTNMVKKYDKEKNTWNELGRLPVRADSSNGWGLAFKACGEQLLVVGGQRGPEGEAIVLSSWCPKSGVRNGTIDWQVLGVKENVGVFVYNCAVMGC